MTYHLNTLVNTEYGVIQLVTNVTNIVKDTVLITSVGNTVVQSNTSSIIINVGGFDEGTIPYDGGLF